MKFARSVAVLSAAVVNLAAAQQNNTLPQVDLGYEVHQAIEYNYTGQYYNFSNIRFAQPPVGNLRFAHPVPPTGRNPVVQVGNQSVICPQASPAWQLIGLQFTAAFSNGSLDSWNYTRARDIAIAQLMAATSQPSMPDPRVTEDCLFLDVFAPKAAFDARNQTSGRLAKRTTTGVPVIVWIYGGGYVLGSKTASGNPAGLLAAANSTGGAIFVAFNYRLGALGWLAGPTFQSEGGISNAALYDQRLAIQWVRENIHLFGGDPNRITLMGESAGGGSIMHQISAFAGFKGVNFQQAIIQSPGWFPISSQYVPENTTTNFYKFLNVSTLAEARAANTSAVMRANALQVGSSQYGQYTYGPTVDGIFVTSQPGISLLNGAYAKNITVMAGHNKNEGVFFAPAYVQTDDDVNSWLRSQYPYAPPQTLDAINYYYPPVYNSTNSTKYPYTSPLTRAIYILSQQIFTCNTNYLARAANNQTYNYEFLVPPALHGYDVPYTFYNGGQGVNVTVAQTLQKYITNFAAKGNPNGPGLPAFPMQGMNASILGLGNDGIQNQVDETVSPACAYFQKYLYT